MKKTLIVVAVLILAAFIVLKFGIPAFANLFMGLGIDLPIPVSWIMHLPIALFAGIAITFGAVWFLLRKMRRR